MDIRLEPLLGGHEGWGHEQGGQVRKHLEALLAAAPHEQIIRISLAGITRTDVPFARTAIVELAVCERMKRGFCLTDIEDEDILDNWDAASHVRQHPLMVWSRGSWRILGPPPGVGVRATLNAVLSRQDPTTARHVADALQVSLSNASNKLHALWQAGYVLRHEFAALRRGQEYTYSRIA